MNELSTGYEELSDSNFKQALLFEDGTCPRCGDQLLILIKTIRSDAYRIRFECKRCGFVCPIYHDLENGTIKPLYDDSIKKFKQEFYNIRN